MPFNKKKSYDLLKANKKKVVVVEHIQKKNKSLQRLPASTIKFNA